MIIHYLDASAWVKRYIQEAGTLWTQRLFDAQSSLACASLGFIEVLATLTRKQRAGEISAMDYDDARRILDFDWQAFVEVRLDAATVAIAADVVRQFALRGADAVHLASALHLRQRLKDERDAVILVAADQELKLAALASGFTVQDPAEEEQADQPAQV